MIVFADSPSRTGFHLVDRSASLDELLSVHINADRYGRISLYFSDSRSTYRVTLTDEQATAIGAELNSAGAAVEANAEKVPA